MKKITIVVALAVLVSLTVVVAQIVANNQPTSIVSRTHTTQGDYSHVILVPQDLTERQTDTLIRDEVNVWKTKKENVGYTVTLRDVKVVKITPAPEEVPNTFYFHLKINALLSKQDRGISVTDQSGYDSRLDRHYNYTTGSWQTNALTPS